MKQWWNRETICGQWKTMHAWTLRGILQGTKGEQSRDNGVTIGETMGEIIREQ